MNLALLIGIFEVKHYLADYVLQVEYHLGKFKEKGWVMPLASHCLIHALFTWFILACLSSGVWEGSVFQKFWWLALVDFAVHFVMDRIKASPRLLGRFKSLTAAEYIRDKERIANRQSKHAEAVYAQKRLRGNRLFWLALGFDQLIHQFTGLYICIMIAK